MINSEFIRHLLWIKIASLFKTHSTGLTLQPKFHRNGKHRFSERIPRQDKDFCVHRTRTGYSNREFGGCQARLPHRHARGGGASSATRGSRLPLGVIWPLRNYLAHRHARFMHREWHADKKRRKRDCRR